MKSLSRFNKIPTNLEILAEEAAEVIQAKSKVFRFGFEDFHPKNKLPGREKLEQEIGHFLAMVEILLANGVITNVGVANGIKHKFGKLDNYYQDLANL